MTIEKQDYDVLSFNPQAARDLLRRIQKQLPARIQFVTSNDSSVIWAQVVKKQWQEDLGVDMDIIVADFPTWLQTVLNGTFRHVALSGSIASYTDPTWFLDLFTNANGYGTHWNDAQYNLALAEAKETTDANVRITRLAECERSLLRAMPILPLSYWVSPDLIKPYVRGLGANLLDRQQLKYVWIDTNWRLS